MSGSGVALPSSVPDNYRSVLSADALAFLAELERRFGGRRRELLGLRERRARTFDFLPETKSVREGAWQVAPTPADLQDRRVEITGPAEPKMVINALNSGAKAFMCDFEDSLSPTWEGVLLGQRTLAEAVRRTLTFTASDTGKSYELGDELATLLVRPRGWHLPEKHLTVDGEPMSGSLFDFGLAFFHNAKEALQRGTGPYFYLPKMESHLEARLWNDVFNYAQDRLDIPRGRIKVTVLIETFPAAFEMEEILFELKDHITGLNAGRWDYIFSAVKKVGVHGGKILPDRSQVTMTVPFMRSYAELLVKTCHKRGAHAMGGMAAFIPSRRDAEVNRVALAKVKEDKEREAGQGFDGTWVAHPDLVPVAMAAFDAKLGDKPNQKQELRPDVRVAARDLLDLSVPNGKVTEDGIVLNIDVALQYMDHWLAGLGAVALHNLMEDAATAEISRAQLWQWVHQGAVLDDGRRVTAGLYRELRARELKRLEQGAPGRYGRAVELLDNLVLDDRFADFLTLPAYRLL